MADNAEDVKNQHLIIKIDGDAYRITSKGKILLRYRNIGPVQIFDSIENVPEPYRSKIEKYIKIMAG